VISDPKPLIVCLQIHNGCESRLLRLAVNFRRCEIGHTYMKQGALRCNDILRSTLPTTRLSLYTCAFENLTQSTKTLVVLKRFDKFHLVNRIRCPLVRRLLSTKYALSHEVLVSSANKAVVDIRLRLRCAIPPHPSRPIGRIACTQKFS